MVGYLSKIICIDWACFKHIYEFGGIKNLSQFLELGIAAGFLMGTYMMAKDNAQGYLWLTLGNASCASLMGIEGYFILMAQQLVSLAFVIDAILMRRKKRMFKSGSLRTGRYIG